jgi:hypothetical protein
MFLSFPPGQSRLVDSHLFSELFLGQSMNPSIFPNLFSQVIHLFLKRTAAKKLNNFRNLGQKRLDLVLLPKVNCDIVNIKPAGKLALGKLQIQPSGLDVVAPCPQNIRVFLLMNRLSCL